ncbi:hypothetical protein [Escherichia coli]|nr:hypothetical protein [Escherichia coli]MCN8087347.1 hypothetical protein [Escherichia coli]
MIIKTLKISARKRN